MLAALLILLMMALITVGLNPGPQDFRWFLMLRRPAWLSFERWIPLIWLLIYACFYASALLCWTAGGRWDLQLGYGGLLLLVQSYTLVICRTRRIGNGTLIGLLGWMWGVALAVVVAPLSTGAWLLLLPYLLWSPIGTLVTWQMQRLNR